MRKRPLLHDPECLTWIREAVGLSQCQLARLANIAQPHLSEVESGVRNTTPAQLDRLARALGCPRSALLAAPALAIPPNRAPPLDAA
jgi:transcriptional regulator with XRE-family HTH domain